MSRPNRWAAVALTFGALLLAPAKEACAAVRSIEEFLAEKEKWPALARSGRPVTLEGRLSSYSETGNRLAFQKLELTFRMEPGRQLPQLPKGASRIEVAGRLVRKGEAFEFLVRDLRTRPGDLETYRIRSRAVPAGRPEAWYELGRWALRRAEFYEDADLKARALEAFAKALSIERKRLGADDWRGRLDLAAKARSLKLAGSLRQELVHEAYVVRRRSMLKAKQPDWERLAADVARDLPGAKAPLDSPQPQLRKVYRADPLEQYRSAGTDERTKLHRILYGEIVLAAIEAKAAGATDGYRIAAKIDERLPERHALAEEYRERELAYRLEHVGNASRRSMLELSRLLRGRGRPEQARLAVENWVKAQEQRLRRDGPAGLVRLADEHLALLDDKQTAFTLLKEAWAQSPGSSEIARRLARLGYIRTNGRWMTQKEIDELPPDPTETAIRRGQVLEGMTPEDVRRALAGDPANVTRIASARHVSETWTYGTPGGSRIIVHFLRARNDPPAEMRVLRVVQAAGPP